MIHLRDVTCIGQNGAPSTAQETFRDVQNARMSVWMWGNCMAAVDHRENPLNSCLWCDVL